MDRWLYQDLAEPPPAATLAGEEVTLDKWYIALAEPVRRKQSLRAPLGGGEIRQTELLVWPATADGARADGVRIKLASLEIKHLAAVGTLPGVVILQAAARNGPGTGQLQSSSDGTRLAWRAPGSDTFGAAVVCGSDGPYLLEDGEDPNKWLRVQIYASYLASTPRDARVYLGDLFANGPPHDDVTAQEASAGDVTIYSLELVNESAVNISDLRAWIHATVSGLEISDDNATWVNPTTEATGLSFGSLASGASKTLWLRRTIAAAAASDAKILTLLHFAWNGL